VAGGGEDQETPLEAAKRELFEETQTTPIGKIIVLDSSPTIPMGSFMQRWGEDI
jgi:dATP pyrophosphohydrolase